jgi:hypothetical protein
MMPPASSSSVLTLLEYCLRDTSLITHCQVFTPSRAPQALSHTITNTITHEHMHNHIGKHEPSGKPHSSRQYLYLCTSIFLEKGIFRSFPHHK